LRDQLWWYVARSSGIVAWALATASVLWGLALSTKVTGTRPRPNWVLDLHRFLGGAAAVFVGIHVGSIVLDTYVHFGLADILLPLASSWHPVAVGWGIVAMYLLAAVEITSLLKRRLSKRVWRMTHLLSFPLYALATVHALSAGTDRGTPLFRIAVVVSVMAVTGLTLMRLLQVDQALNQAAVAEAEADAEAERAPERSVFTPATRPPVAP
jgi:DMSO/TMAO reductase YedYZ heme-binding membrane subunit